MLTLICNSNEGSLLAEAITRHMAEIGEGFSEDPVRLFFRTRVRQAHPSTCFLSLTGRLTDVFLFFDRSRTSAEPSSK